MGQSPTTDLPPYPAGEPTAAAGDATVHGTDEASSWHDAGDGARAVPLEEFSLTRDQVAAMYAAAGVEVKPRTVSRYGQEGVLRAKLVDAERGLKRYLYNQGSVEEDIAKRLRGPDPIYAPTDADEPSDDATLHDAGEASSRHDAGGGAGTMPWHQPPSSRGDRMRELELELATMRGRMTEKDKRHEEDRDAIERLRAENGGLRIALGEAKGKLVFAQERLRLLEGPRPAAPVSTGPPGDDGGTPTSRRRRWWWR
jgi:hypothetical protein